MMIDQIQQNNSIYSQQPTGTYSQEQRAVKSRISHLNSVAKVGVGLAAFPVVFGTEIIAQSGFKEIITRLGKEKEVSVYADIGKILFDIKNFAYGIIKRLSSEPSRECWQLFYKTKFHAGNELIFRELTQCYLLDKKLSILLSKISPELGEFPKTRTGTVLRIVLTSAFYTWLIQRHDNENFAKKINNFIYHISSGMLREATDSIIPGVALNVIRDRIDSFY